MHLPDDPDGAAVFDFIDEYLADVERGRRCPLSHYLARYPGSEPAVAREYLRLADDDAEPAEDLLVADAADEAARLGPYRLVRELGRGGQGTVFLGEDTRIARKVALKVLASPVDAVSVERLERFRREAEVIARLEHPGLCAIYDTDLEGATPYIAMRFVEGETLAARIERARSGADSTEVVTNGRPDGTGLSLPPRSTLGVHAVLAFFERAARALHAAHEVGVVHRDVKPGNVMVGDGREPVVLDFGLASDERSDTGLTLSGDVFGTPAYMSPEQLEGSSTLDRRTDVYSLGATLFEAVTLRRPYEGPTRAALYEAIRRTPLPNPRAVTSALPPDLTVVLETAMEKDRNRRYATALELAEDLRRIREYEPIRARPAPLGLRVARWTRRHPVLAVTLLLLTSALGLSLWLLAKEQRALRYALARHLADRSVTLAADDQGASLALAIEAAERDENYLTRGALFDALDACWLERALDGSSRVVTDLVAAPDGETARFLAGQYDGRAILWNLATGVAELELDGHDGPITCVARMGDVGVTGAADGRVIAWDLPRGTRRATFEHDAPVSWVLALDAGRQVACGTDDGRLHVHDVATGREVATATLATDGADAPLPTQACTDADGSVLVAWNAHGAWSWHVDDPTPRRLGAGAVQLEQERIRVHWVEIAPAGDEVVVATDDGVRFIALDDGDEVRAPRLTGIPIGCARYAPDGRRVAVAPLDDERPRAIVLDLDGSGRVELTGHRNRRVGHVAFAPDGRRIATASHDLTVRVFDVATGVEEHVYKSNHQPAAVHWSPDGTRVVARYNGPVVQVWFATARPDVYTLDGHTGPINAVAFSADGGRALTASDDGTVRVWHTPPRATGAAAAGGRAPGTPLAVLDGHAGAVVAAAFSSDGTQVLSAARDGTARISDARSGALVAEPLRRPSPLVSAAFAADGAVVCVDAAGRALVWRPEDGSAHELPLEDEAATCARVSADGRRVAIGTRTGRVHVFATDGEPQGTGAIIEATAARVHDVAWRPDGSELAVACDDLRVRFLDPETGLAAREDVPTFAPLELAFSGDGRLLLVRGARGGAAIRLLDLATGERRRMHEISQTEDLTSGRLSADGSRGVTTSKDGSVYVWDTASGRPFLYRELGQGPVLCVAVSPDPRGERLLCGGTDGTARVFPVDPLPHARARRPRPLRQWERAREERLARPLTYR